jgi:hypothetical protein
MSLSQKRVCGVAPGLRSRSCFGKGGFSHDLNQIDRVAICNFGRRNPVSRLDQRQPIGS